MTEKPDGDLTASAVRSLSSVVHSTHEIDAMHHTRGVGHEKNSLAGSGGREA